jgi:hypothetical protein
MLPAAPRRARGKASRTCVPPPGRARLERAAQAARPLLHDLQAVVRAAVGLRGQAVAVVLDQHLQPLSPSLRASTRRACWARAWRVMLASASCTMWKTWASCSWGRCSTGQSLTKSSSAPLLRRKSSAQAQRHQQAAWVQRHPEVRDDAAQAGMRLRQRAPHVVVVGLGPFVVVRAHGVVQQRHAHLGHRQRLGQRVVHLGGHGLALLQQAVVQGLLLEPRVVQRQAEQFAHHLQQGATSPDGSGRLAHEQLADAQRAAAVLQRQHQHVPRAGDWRVQWRRSSAHTMRPR